MQKNKNVIFVIAVVTLVIIVGVVAYAIGQSRVTESKDSSSKSIEQKTVAEETNKFATLKGDAFDEAYIADMLAHHEGALNMSEMAGAAMGRTEILELSQSIIQSQVQEIYQMQTWQSEWGYEKTMGGHAGHSGMANDMAGSMMDMGASLQGLQGEAFDVKFLHLMIEHHQQAVDMSRYADTNAAHQELKDFAKQVITVQEAEIAQMKQWQKEWGYESVETTDSMPGMNH